MAATAPEIVVEPAPRSLTALSDTSTDLVVVQAPVAMVQVPSTQSVTVTRSPRVASVVSALAPVPVTFRVSAWASSVPPLVRST